MRDMRNTKVKAKTCKPIKLYANLKRKTMSRLCIYPKDIQRITGKSERQARNILTNIKAIHNRQKHQFVSIYELCDYMGISLQHSQSFIK
jgi:hypothetical protein